MSSLYIAIHLAKFLAKEVSSGYRATEHFFSIYAPTYKSREHQPGPCSMSLFHQPLQAPCPHPWRYHMSPSFFTTYCPPRGPIDGSGHPYLPPEGSWWATGLVGGGTDCPREDRLPEERGAAHTEAAPGGTAPVSAPGEWPYAAEHPIPYGRVGGGLSIDLHVPVVPLLPNRGQT